MRFTKIARASILSGMLMLSYPLTASVVFTGGPVLDGTNIKQNVIQNIDMIERHLKQAVDWKALQKIIKERVKSEFSSNGAADMTKEKSKQDLAESVRNHQIAVEMAPVKIAGCGDDSRVDEELEDFEAILIAMFRDLTHCDGDDASAAKIKEREQSDDVIEDSRYNGRMIDGSTPPEQQAKNEELAQKVNNSVSQVRDAVNDLMERAEERAGDGASVEDIARAKVEIENENMFEETMAITQIETEDGVTQPDLITQTLAYLDPDTFPTLTPDLYDEALDSLILMSGVYEKYIAMDTTTAAEDVLNLSEDIQESFPYRSIIGQFNDRMPRGNNPSKIDEFIEMAKFYEADNLAPRIAGTNTIVYQVQREALIAKGFQAVVEVERLKKMLDKERMLAVMLAEKLR